MKDKIKQFEALIDGLENEVTLLATTSAFINTHMSDLSWVGFYIKKGNSLYLGPFQGSVACFSIPLDKGVCGKAATSLDTIIVDDVHVFEGHIACDSRTNSEIVVPITVNSQLYGVLDIDSLSFNRFTEEDSIVLNKYVEILSKQLAQCQY